MGYYLSLLTDTPFFRGSYLKFMLLIYELHFSKINHSDHNVLVISTVLW